MSIRRSAFERSYSSNIDIASRQSSSLIFEFGTAYLRVGIAGESKPRHVFPLSPKLSSQSESSQSSLSLPYWSSIPSLPNDLIQKKHSSYHDLGPWLSNLYTHHLLLKPRSRRVIILLPIYHPTELRTTLESILLNDLQVPSVLFVDSFRTIPYAIGGSSAGMIVDIGCMEGRVVCFFNGHMCENTLQIVPVGFQSLLDRTTTTTTKEVQALGTATVTATATATVTDENVLGLIQEMYFDLDNMNSLIYAFLTSLLQCPIDLRRQVVKNVVFVGGGVEGISQFEQRFIRCIQGLFERDSCTVQCTLPDGTTEERAVYHVKDDRYRRFSSLASVIMTAPLGVLYPLQFRPSCVAWVGGSIMGSVKLTDEKWVNRSEERSF